MTEPHTLSHPTPVAISTHIEQLLSEAFPAGQTAHFVAARNAVREGIKRATMEARNENI